MPDPDFKKKLGAHVLDDLKDLENFQPIEGYKVEVHPVTEQNTEFVIRVVTLRRSGEPPRYFRLKLSEML